MKLYQITQTLKQLCNGYHLELNELEVALIELKLIIDRLEYIKAHDYKLNK